MAESVVMLAESVVMLTWGWRRRCDDREMSCRHVMIGRAMGWTSEVDGDGIESVDGDGDGVDVDVEDRSGRAITRRFLNGRPADQQAMQF